MSRPSPAAPLVIRGARVLDPELGVDRLADVLLSEGRIEKVVEPGVDSPDGVEVIDGSGHVLAPGFIDVHSHSQDIPGLRLQALDGVTTALELEIGVLPVDRAYARATSEGRPVNVGFSASWSTARMLALGQLTSSLGTMSDFADHVGLSRWQQPSSRAELDAIIGLLTDELAAGALGIGIMTAFAPGTDPAEIVEVGRLAAAFDVPTYSHIRDLIEISPEGPIDGVVELADVAEQTGAHMHFCHINSVSTGHVDRVLATVADARSRGLSLTTEAYPYGSGMTNIGAAFLTPDGLRARNLTPADLIYAPTGERVGTEDRLFELRRDDPGGLVFTENLREADPVDRGFLQRALTFDSGIIASDAMPLLWPAHTDPTTWPLPPEVLTHPRTAGCFSRAIRELVRGGTLSLMEVVRRSTLLPAQLLEGASEQMRRKGRVQPGCDADLVLFDPDTVTDQATYAESTRASTGFAAVIVNGVPVVRESRIVEGALPGVPVRGVR